jgi:hypothetical protein
MLIPYLRVLRSASSRGESVYQGRPNQDTGGIGLASAGSAPAPTSTGLTKRAVWTIVVAIVVAALLSGVFAYLQYWAPIKITVHAENTTIDAGGVLNLTVSVKKGLRFIDDTNGVSYRWEAEPAALGSFFEESVQSISLRATTRATER